MATINKKTIKVTRKPLTPRYIARPRFVVDWRSNRPSKECSVEYNALQKEMKSLFAEFSANKVVIAQRRANAAHNRAVMEAKRASYFKRVEVGCSYAHLAAVNSKPSALAVSSPPEEKAVALWSRYKARRDYTAAFKAQQAERFAALELVKAMANRRPIKIYKTRESINLVARSMLKAQRSMLSAERRFARRHPAKEVKEFPFMVYHEVEKMERKYRTPIHEPRGVANATSVKQKKVRSKIIESWRHVEFNRWSSRDTSPRISEERIAFLLFRIKLVRNAIKERISLGDYLGYEFDQIKGQMDEAGEVQETMGVADVKGNIALISSNPPDIGVSHVISDGLQKLSVSRENQVFSTMTDRWISLCSFEWKNHGMGSFLTHDNPVTHRQEELVFLPYYILKVHPDSPNAQILLNHRFFRCGFKLKFILNSSPWMTGALVPNWFYGNYAAGNDHGWFNIYSALQRNHGILQAGSSNTVELDIPYHHYNSYLSNDTSDCFFGCFSIGVLQPLMTVDTVARQAMVTVYVSLNNVEAHGLLSRSVGLSGIDREGIQGQMETIGALCNAVDVGNNLLQTARGAFNRDNPPKPLQPVALVPQTMPSFSFTDGIAEPINVLRADPSGQRPNSVVTQEMNIIRFAQGWGLLSSFDWKFSHMPSNIPLYKTRVMPILSTTEYFQASSVNGIPSAYFPPIAVASSMAGKYRGDIKYKIFVVGNSFYTGTLSISVVPGIRAPEADTIARADVLRSYTQVVDIRKSVEHVITVPWNWYNAWGRVSDIYREGLPYAYLFIHVVNPLIAVATVPSSVKVFVFVAAGDNYELAQMHTPILALASEVVKPPDDEYLKPYNFESAWYLTTNHRAVDSKSRYFRTPYIQNVSEGFVGYLNVEPGIVYRLANKTLKGLYFRMKTEKNVVINYGTYFPDYSTVNAQGVIVFTSLVAAKYFIRMAADKKIDQFFDKYPNEQWTANGPWSETSTDDINWQTAVNDNGDHPIFIKMSVEDLEFEDPTGQMDARGQYITIESHAPGTQLGLTVYGEKMPDMKGICRRWQYHSSIRVQTCNSAKPTDCMYACKIPVRPSRIIKPGTSASAENRLRDGSMALFNSCFYLWEGGHRYRIIAVKKVPNDTMMFVQHRFDDDYDSQVVLTPQQAQDHLSAKGLMDTHYATYSQALAVNPVISVEVPYYRETERLASHSSNYVYLNGYLYIWLHSAEKSDVDLEIYHSVADDFQWTIFQGIPAMINIRDITDEPKGQMDEDSGLWFVEPRPTLKPFFEENRVEEVEPQGILDYITSPVTSAVKTSFESIATSHRDNFDVTVTNIGTAAKVISEEVPKTTASVQKVTETFEKITTKLQSFIELAEGLPERLGDVKSTTFLGSISSGIYDYVTHFVYVAMNPNGRTAGWALVNLYKKIWGFTTDGFELAVEAIANIWNRASEATQQPQPSGQMEDTDISSLCSILYCSLCSLLKISVCPPHSWSEIVSGLFQFGNITRTSSFVGMFIRDNITLIKRVWTKILSYFAVSTPNYHLISGVKDQRLRQWCIHAASIIHPGVREKVITSPLWAEKAFELATVGRALTLALSQDKSMPVSLNRIITENNAALRKLEEELINRKVFCGERYEPYCLWISGSAGVGKTRLLQTVASNLAEKLQVSCAQTYHTLTIGQQYFDGYVGQPSVLIDDYLAMNPTTDGVSNMFVQMKSSCLFNPPYSDVKDKAKCVNFYNLLISSNFNGVNNIPGIHDNDAYNRRRDLLLRMEARPLGAEPWTLEQYQNLEHCDMYHIPDPLKPDQGHILIKRVERESYAKTVLDFINKSAEEYHHREALAYTARAVEKIKRLEKVEKADSIEEYLAKAESLYALKVDMREHFGSVFDYWNKPQVKTLVLDEEGKVRSGEEEPSGQIGEEELFTPLWPTVEASDTQLGDDVSVGVFEPLKRKVPAKFSNKCLHNCLKDYKDYFFLKEGGCFIHCSPMPKAPLEEIPLSFNVDFCYEKLQDGSVRIFPGCRMKDEVWAMEFNSNLVSWWLQGAANMVARYPYLDQEDLVEVEDFPIQVIVKVQNQLKAVVSTHEYHGVITKSVWKIRDLWIVLKLPLQDRLASEHVTVGETVLPRESKIRSISKKVWKGFVKVALVIEASVVTLSRIVGIAGMLVLGTSVGVGLWNFYHTEPQIHPSGDYKTMKTRPTTRMRAMNLVKHEGHAPQDDTLPVGATDAEIIKSCSEHFVDPSADGRLKGIVSNVFTLIGLVPLNDVNMLTYKARCIGLKKTNFLVLKHYIDLFISKGVTEVVVVRHNGKGIQRFQLSTLEFLWTNGGYGMGTFPSLAQPFKNITKYIPTENFDGNYPYELYMVEVFIDEVRIRPLNCARIKSPVLIPQNGAQQSWKIEQGFSYGWGGAGKCGSFLFAPTMATPFVAVHTAGIGEKQGYSEILLRETFVQEEEIYVDFVVPQMETKESGFELPGDGYLVGHLAAEKAINLPTKTKIEPSEIHGVFPIMTEPAPLVGSDPRLPPGSSPLLEGVRRRCEPVKDFPVGLLNQAYADYRLTILAEVVPLRDPAALTITEAIEGLTLPGYDPLTIKTSEGYPWTLDRPKTASDKSWMFQFDTYPDGRRQLKGIYGKLSNVLNMKESLRERGIIPATYYTACLKDARIAKEKVSIPGKTRLFEMSPVDLTIAQRQYFLDFYAGYQAARFDAENTIGINPDGAEWTELAQRLTSFSPHILTADYSGYGPKLLMSVQFHAYLTQIGWYEHYQTMSSHSEESIDRDFRIRYSMVWEMLYPLTVVKDAVVRFNNGMPSGNAGTVIVNSQCNSIYIRVIYLHLAYKFAPAYSDMHRFHQYVLMLSNGDDLIIAVKDEIISWFNNATIIEAFAEYGIKMTDALKSGKVRPYCTIEEATYLKRGFLPHPTREGQYLAPLEEASITDTANWVWRSVDKREASLVNSEMACRLAYTHGPQYYNRIVDKITDKWLGLGVKFSAPSWEALDAHIWDGEPGPTYRFV
ncbi:polyprotein [Tetrastichus brontispae RNA virus 3]|nr:polyprotein [Tetrastichus brontispae RNA virus 3]